ncbi:hypothetical protein D3C81_1916550 [compost metagenome]
MRQRRLVDRVLGVEAGVFGQGLRSADFFQRRLQFRGFRIVRRLETERHRHRQRQVAVSKLPFIRLRRRGDQPVAGGQLADR